MGLRNATTQSIGKKSAKQPVSNGTNGHSQKSSPISDSLIKKAYHEMYRARCLDLKAIVLYKQNKCHFQIGTAGHEAAQVAVALTMKPNHDWFYPYYRDLALCSTLGMTDEEFMMNCMNKKGDPNSHGQMMPMHYGSKSLRIVNQSSPTGTQFLQAVGCALGAKYKKLQEITYVSSGEGTCSQGDFHEALSWASRDKLPILFFIENNQYAISVHVSEQLGANNVYELTSGYQNLTRYSMDGTDFLSSYKTVQEAYQKILDDSGPVLIEAHVPRLQSHSISDDHNKYRSKEDIDAEKSRCPIGKLRSHIIKEKILTDKELTELEKNIRSAVDDAAESAEQSPNCDPLELPNLNVVANDPALNISEGVATGEEIYLVDAINHALDEELTRNKDILIFGQDVAHGKGGVFTVTAGLTKKHGVERVFNAPLAESSIVGVSIGLATRGLKPVSEIQFGDYVWTGMMQLRNELAMMHHRSGGDFTCPAVIRIPVGGYIHGGAYHSQNIEATFSHFPGLYVLYPSNATDAKALLKSAIRGSNPVLFLEHKGLYRQVYAKGPEGDKDFLLPLGKGKIVRPGTDMTIVSWGAIVQKSILAAQALAEKGVSVEVIDIRSIVPLDMDLIIESVQKTSRVLIAHEDVEFMGFGAEIAAQASEKCFQFLDAPVRRIGMKYAAIVPHAPVLEHAVLPQNEDVLNAARELLAY